MFAVTLVSESRYAMQMSTYERERERRRPIKDGKSFSFSLWNTALNYILVIYYAAADGGVGALCCRGFFNFFFGSVSTPESSVSPRRLLPLTQRLEFILPQPGSSQPASQCAAREHRGDISSPSQN